MSRLITYLDLNYSDPFLTNYGICMCICKDLRPHASMIIFRIESHDSDQIFYKLNFNLKCSELLASFLNFTFYPQVIINPHLKKQKANRQNGCGFDVEIHRSFTGYPGRVLIRVGRIILRA